MFIYRFNSGIVFVSWSPLPPHKDAAGKERSRIDFTTLTFYNVPALTLLLGYSHTSFRSFVHLSHNSHGQFLLHYSNDPSVTRAKYRYNTTKMLKKHKNKQSCCTQ